MGPEFGHPRHLFLLDAVDLLALAIEIKAISRDKLQIGRVLSKGVQLTTLLLLLVSNMGFQRIPSGKFLLETA